VLRLAGAWAGWRGLCHARLATLSRAPDHCSRLACHAHFGQCTHLWQSTTLCLSRHTPPHTRAPVWTGACARRQALCWRVVAADALGIGSVSGFHRLHMADAVASTLSGHGCVWAWQMVSAAPRFFELADAPGTHTHTSIVMPARVAPGAAVRRPPAHHVARYRHSRPCNAHTIAASKLHITVRPGIRHLLLLRDASLLTSS
jgi:hypothetical protein